MDFTNKTYFFNYVKFCAMLGALIGFVVGVFYAFGGLMLDTMVSLDLLSAGTMGTSGLGFGTILAFGALIGMPVIFALFSVPIGILIAGTFNMMQFFKARSVSH